MSDCSVLASKEYKKLADENICLKPETISKIVELSSDKIKKDINSTIATYKEIRKDNDC